MRLFQLSFFFLLLFSFCDQKRKLRQTYKQATFNTEIISALPLYDSLKNILVLHIDTVFKFRNRSNFTFHVYENGDTGTIQQNSDFYHFYFDFDSVASKEYYADSTGGNQSDLLSRETIPSNIYPSVVNIIKQLGREKITDFYLYTDGSVDFQIKEVRKESLVIQHRLIWKSMFAENTDPAQFFKDTAIAPGWTYRIWVGEP